ncbi:MAG: sulfatase [Chloroflexota bacterium]
MKAIMVMFDSLNRHMLPNYGCDWTHAPNFQRLAERTVTFDNCYIGSMPCMPTRRELHTGRYNFLHRSWGPLEPFDDSMPALLSQHGVYTHLVSDHMHYWEDGGATYHSRYDSWECERGHEGDHWKGQVGEPPYPESYILPNTKSQFRYEMTNRQYMQNEEAMPQARTFANGLDFIDRNHAEDSWFLQIETFDPHEPFFTQQQWKDLYPHDYDGPHFDWPAYKPATEPADQIQHMRNEYAALLSMCDAYLGKVLDKMDALDLWEDTLLIVNTDHGFLLGEHGWWAKNLMPWYNELAHIPFFVWDPRSGKRGERRDALVQTIDLAPTLLDYFEVEIPAQMRGTPLHEAIARDRPVRDAALFGTYGAWVSVTDGRYVYMRANDEESDPTLYEYTLMPTHMNHMFTVDELQETVMSPPMDFTKGCPVMKIPYRARMGSKRATLLFDLQSDPNQESPIINDEIELRMIQLMVDVMASHHTQPEQYVRLGLPQDGQITDAHLHAAKHHELALQVVAVPEDPAAGVPDEEGSRFRISTPLADLLDHPQAKAVLAANLPPEMIQNIRTNAMLREVSLRRLATFMPELLSKERLGTIAVELAEAGK